MTFFPRMFQRADQPDGEAELQIGLEVYKLLASLPYAAQIRVLHHTAQILEERHQMRALDTLDPTNGL